MGVLVAIVGAGTDRGVVEMALEYGAVSLTPPRRWKTAPAAHETKHNVTSERYEDMSVVERRSP